MLIDEIIALTELDGVSGSEDSVREYIKSAISQFADEMYTDSIGNLVAVKKGDSSKKVMLSAHMDEVGLIVSGITDKGFLEFKTVGGIDTRVILSKKVRIGKKRIPGVIGMKAIHLQKRTERENVPEIRELYIDIGAKDKEDAQKNVNLGDYVAFDTETEVLGENTLKAKALDDRIGCAVLMELIKKQVKYDTYFCFTTQEEVGLRGAMVCSYKINPDIALVIESTTASDVYGSEERDYVTDLGGGAAITFMDRRTIVEKSFRSWLYQTAQSNNIPVQYKRAVSGGNDAGRIHLSKGGIKTASVSLPTRYLHSPCSLASIKDIDAVYKISEMFLDKIDEVI